MKLEATQCYLSVFSTVIVTMLMRKIKLKYCVNETRKQSDKKNFILFPTVKIVGIKADQMVSRRFSDSGKAMLRKTKNLTWLL